MTKNVMYFYHFLLSELGFFRRIRRSEKEFKQTKVATIESLLSIDYFKAREKDRNTSLSAVITFFLCGAQQYGGTFVIN